MSATRALSPDLVLRSQGGIRVLPVEATFSASLAMSQGAVIARTAPPLVFQAFPSAGRGSTP